jgi:glycosyltransferase involved in cell wall biosynthesis
MNNEQQRVRVLYSFPHKIGADRICNTAWRQVDGVIRAGVDVLLYPGVLHKPFAVPLEVHPTLSLGKRLRIPYRVLGRIKACALHDYIVSRHLEKEAERIDAIHGWPLGALRTFRVAKKLGIPTFLERPNSHTRYAYEVVQQECDRLGVALPPGHEHAYNEVTLRIEEEEYRLADYLLCPSDFVSGTFRDKGFPPEKLIRHSYGFDDKVFYPDAARSDARSPLRVLFVGVCAVRKGLHFALEAWLKTSASRNGGVFFIAGEFVPEYEKKLAPLLRHSSVHALGHQKDVAALMRTSDVFILPTIEEGSPLSCAEAIGSGCVPLVSEVCAGLCQHMINSLVHPVGDVETLSRHIQLLDADRQLLATLRANALAGAHEHTWAAAGSRLAEIYRAIGGRGTRAQASA